MASFLCHIPKLVCDQPQQFPRCLRTPLATVRTQTKVVHHQIHKSKKCAALCQMIRAVDESAPFAGPLLDHAMVTLRSGQLDTKETDGADLSCNATQDPRNTESFWRLTEGMSRLNA